MNAEEFNALYEVGVPVFAYPGCRPEDFPSDRRLVTRTRSKASVLGGHTDVVWVEDHSACIALSHVDVVSESVWEAAKEAEAIAESFASMDDRGIPEPSTAEEKRARLFGFVQAGAEEGDLPSFAAALNEYVEAARAEGQAPVVEYGVYVPDSAWPEDGVLLDGDTLDRADQEARLERCRCSWPNAVLVQRSVRRGEWTEATS